MIARGLNNNSMQAENHRLKAEQKRFFKDFLTGGASAAVSKTLTAPMERVKLILQNQDASRTIRNRTLPYQGIRDCFKRVLREQGLVSFWRGSSLSVIRYIPSTGANFALKNQYKKLGPRGDDTLSTAFRNVVAGGAAGATSLLVAYPLDLARTRLALDVG
jgi:solute carrier family 25 (adenine nucleotide translocator) protein 4/5/6/31